MELLAGFFCTDEEIAGALKTDTATLMSPLNRDTFLQRKKTGQENGKCALRRKQFDLADKSVTMAIFLGRQYLGQAGGAVQTQTEGTPPSRLELALRHLAQTVTPADADTPEGIADEEEEEWIG